MDASDVLVFCAQVLLVFVGLVSLFPLTALVLWMIGVLGARRVPLKKLLLLTYGDDLAYGALNFPGRSFNANGVVESVPGGPNKHDYCNCPWITSWRSWIFYFAWLVKPVPYDENNDPDGFGSSIYIDLADHFVTVHVEDAETKDIQDPAHPTDPTKKIAGPSASFDAQCPGSVIDPRLFVVGSPPDVFKVGIVAEFEAAMRKYARLKYEAELLDASVGGEIGTDLLNPAGVNAQAVFDTMRTRWGFSLPPEYVTIKAVSFSKEYQEARQSARQEAMKAQATGARIFNPIKDAIAAGIGVKDAVRLQELNLGAQVVDLNVHSNDQSINPEALVIGGGANAGILVGNKGNKGGNPPNPPANP